MKKYFLFYICITMSLNACVNDDWYDSSQINEQEPVKTDRESLSKQTNISDEIGMSADSYKDYEKMMHIFNMSHDKSLEKGMYPDYYGGSYVDGYGKLVIMMKEMKSQAAKAFMNEFANVEFKNCQYSHNELQNVVDSIKYKIKCGAEHCKNIIMLGIEEIDNSISVYFRHNDEKAIQDFKNNISSFPRIIFGQCSDIEDHYLICGDMFAGLGWGSYGIGSFGYRAIDGDGNEGYVTAGHCISPPNLVYTDLTFTTPIGYCSSSEYDNGYIDAAFCVIDGVGNEPTNKIRYMTTPSVDTLHTDLYQPPSNVYVNMIGYASGHRNSGHVKYNSHTVYSNGNCILTDVILADYASISGDSGGLVYMLVSSINKRYTVGINKGRVTLADGTTYAVCIKAYLINSRLGISRY